MVGVPVVGVPVVGVPVVGVPVVGVPVVGVPVVGVPVASPVVVGVPVVGVPVVGVPVVGVPVDCKNRRPLVTEASEAGGAKPQERATDASARASLPTRMTSFPPLFTGRERASRCDGRGGTRLQAD